MKASITRDEHALLQKSNHSLTFITKSTDAPLGFAESVAHAWQMCLAFICTLFACTVKWWTLSFIFAAIALLVLAWNTGKLCLLVIGINAHSRKSHMRRPSLIFWLWWPVLSVISCYVAAALGALLGIYLWRHNFTPYYHLATLQRYQAINPAVTAGDRVQDAGLVTFDADADLDRQHGGCFVDGGHTYCVAPIVPLGKAIGGLADTPRTGSYDFFAVGVDCCSCPNQDFQCGAWSNPLAQGGIRSLDYRSRPFYKLAIDAWTASYDRTADHPIFFDWVQDPEAQWHYMFSWAAEIITLAIAGFIALSFFFALAMEHLLRALVRHDLASAVGVPPPPQGFGWVWEKLLPGAHKHYTDLMQQHHSNFSRFSGSNYGSAMPPRAKRWYGPPPYIPFPPPYPAAEPVDPPL
mmetsp:Transcript_73966/g.176037  ORF Transcript_73966/g.176037 Transcript_73966/m.176037 type:complete len:408 (+) Transcript_73966:167-1390(+)